VRVLKLPSVEEVLENSIRYLKSPDALASAMRDIQKHHAQLNLMNEYHWNEMSLSDGYPGILLLFSTLSQLGDNFKWAEEIEHSYVIKIKTILESQGVRSLSLFSGLAGICFAIHYASHAGTRYQKMLNTLNSTLIAQAENFYLRKLEENYKLSHPSPSHLYDLIQGICGIGRYALEHLHQPVFQAFLEKIIISLICLCQPIHIDETLVPGWYVSSDDNLNKIIPNLKNGNFNLGLSHGVTGILAFLSIARLKGILVEGQKELILTLSQWLKSKAFVYNQVVYWPPTISWNEETNNQSLLFTQNINDSWCYGTPGISRTLFLAGKALEDDKLIEFASNAFEKIFLKSEKERNLPGPALCHGNAGLLLITLEMSKNKKDQFDPYIKPLFQNTLNSYAQENLFGFSDLEMNTTQQYVRVHKPGFLEGSSGILLALLSTQSKEFNWHLPMLIA
jgi:lantibiotic biosynthesis protein